MIRPITRREFLRQSTAAGASLTLFSLLGSSPARAGTGEAAPPAVLLEALRLDDPILPADAARLLGDLGSPAAVGPLIRYVQTHGSFAKTAGLDALGRLGDRGACGALRELADDPRVDDDSGWWYGSTAVRLAAALALLALGDDSRAEWLMDDDRSKAGIDRKEWALFCWFAPAVLRLPDTLEATRRLKGRITVEALAADSREAHRFIHRCDALGLLGTEEAAGVLAAMLGHASRYVRGRAAVNLLRVSDRPYHVDRVVWVAHNDPADFARVKACEALARHGRHLYGRRLAAAFNDGLYDPFDRAAAVESLGLLGDVSALTILQQHSKHDDPYVRLCAVEALERLGTPAALAAAGERAGDEDLRVRMQVAKAMAANGRGGSNGQ
ncbi:MAG: HEAT repeat domain-containing protein [Planctomycetes bacterium]|nr:HEAT repeat domain-containing protein [Planctomycetota bacterium]